MWQEDPLLVVNPKVQCPVCKGTQKQADGQPCPYCVGTGLARAHMQGFWSPSPGFLVCGGPSLNSLPLDRLKDRGVVSLGVNNVAGHAHVKAFVFGDGQYKFHHGLFFDPGLWCFVPLGKLKRGVRAKLPDGSWRGTTRRVRECPGVFGFSHSGRLDPPNFFGTHYSQWGYSGGDKCPNAPFRRLMTMLHGLRLMHWLGCPRVYLLGVDFDRDSKDPGKAYAFNEHGSGGMKAYLKQETILESLVPTFAAAKFECFNCNPASKCVAFPHVPFADALADCKGAVPEEPFDLAQWYSHGVKNEWDAKKLPALTVEELTAIQQKSWRPPDEWLQPGTGQFSKWDVAPPRGTPCPVGTSSGTTTVTRESA